MLHKKDLLVVSKKKKFSHVSSSHFLIISVLVSGLLRNYVNVYKNSLKLHTLSHTYEIWHGVSWHIGVSSKIGFWCLLPLYFKISPTTFPETQKNLLSAWQILIKYDFFKHFMVNIATSPVYRKITTFIGFNMSPRWSFYLENYCFCSQNTALYLKSEIFFSLSSFTEAFNLTMKL